MTVSIIADLTETNGEPNVQHHHRNGTAAIRTGRGRDLQHAHHVRGDHRNILFHDHPTSTEETEIT